jgi:hypothetical protein
VTAAALIDLTLLAVVVGVLVVILAVALVAWWRRPRQRRLGVSMRQAETLTARRPVP